MVGEEPGRAEVLSVGDMEPLALDPAGADSNIDWNCVNPARWTDSTSPSWTGVEGSPNISLKLKLDRAVQYREEVLRAVEVVRLDALLWRLAGGANLAIGDLVTGDEDDEGSPRLRRRVSSISDFGANRIGDRAGEVVKEEPWRPCRRS